MAENQHIEWKESWRDEYLKWICAFANAQGGVLEIGRDNRGRVILNYMVTSNHLLLTDDGEVTW
jgi:predicted HTH transcriptional regulator